MGLMCGFTLKSANVICKYISMLVDFLFFWDTFVIDLITHKVGEAVKDNMYKKGDSLLRRLVDVAASAATLFLRNRIKPDFAF